MKTCAVLACCAGAATAFHAPLPARSLARSSASRGVTMMAEMSKSLPFMERPAALDGSAVGDVGFDPLGLSANLDPTHTQAAELKHGRVAMLAVVGFLVEQFVHLPADQFSATNPLKAVAMVPLAGHLQIFALIAFFELTSLKKMYSGTSTDPWELLSQDPAGAKGFKSKSAAEQAKSKLQEIKNGRLAMLAIMGEILQMALFDKPTLSF